CGTKTTNLNTLASYKTYNWTLEPSGEQVSNLPRASINEGGTYSVIVTDNNGCSGQTSKPILGVPQPTAKVFTTSNDICSRNEIRNVTLSTIEGSDYVYEWFVNGTKITNNDSPKYSFDQNLAIPGTSLY